MKRSLLQMRTGLFSLALALVSLVALTGTATSSPHTAQPAPVLPQTVDPVRLYSIEWTATGQGSSDVTEYGVRTVKNRQIAQAGSAIWRKYAAGGFDTVPFNWTVTDDYDEVVTSSCSQGGSDRTHSTWTITDPNRYSGGPNMGIIVNDPIQRPDGSWYMLDPMVSLYNVALFGYRYDDDYVYCGGDPGGSTATWDNASYAVLMYPGTLEGDSAGKVFTKTSESVFPYDPPLTIKWNITVRLLETRDLTVDRLEVTQALQDKANSIPLIQGRRTVVRAYLGVGRDAVAMPNVTGKLTGYAGASVLGSIAPFNPGGRITAPADPDWMKINDTLNFELPRTWTLQTNLRLEVEVNHDHSVTEINYNNNMLSSAPLPLLPCNGVGITYTPINYTPPGGFAPADPSASINVGAEFMRRIYPLPDNGLTYFPTNVVNLNQNINSPGIDSAVLAFLQTKLLSSSAPRAEHIFGWLPSLAFDGNGEAYWPGVPGFGNDTKTPNRWRRTFAHELGHNYGIDDDFTSTETTAGAHWFDVYDRVIKPVPASIGGKDLLDFMVPARLEPEAWISPNHYKYLVNKICVGGAGAAANNLIQPSLTVDTLLVSGTINNTAPDPASGGLDPLYHFTSIPTYILPEGAQYCLNLRNAANSLLGQYCFNQDFSGDTGSPVDSAAFGMVVPYPAGLHHVDLVKGASILGTRVASSNPPTVSVTYPNATGLTLSGAHDITWSGADLDAGTTLTYEILYSRDNGATWQGLASGITGSAYSLDFSGLPGTSGASGKIKVMVSDGFYSAEDTSDNPFTIGNKPPQAAIVSPPSGAEFTTGPNIVLLGAGMDLEDGSMGDSTLSWESSLDGALGTGKLLEVSLSPGIHTLTLTATDSNGLFSTASIQITVVEPPTITIIYSFLPMIRR